ncbi:MAG: hypothetical protein AB7N76_14150 [Planctomycetota bacterium]
MRQLAPAALLLALLAGGPALAADPRSPRPAQPQPQPAGPYGVLRCDATQVRYELTTEDALWATRMLVGEAGGRDDVDDAAVLWTMLNSYAIRDVRKHYPSFAAFVRAYCTPLQPYLKSQGALRRHQKKKTPLVEVEPGKFQLKRHVELQQRAWEKLPQGARDLVLRVFRGQQQTPCGAATQFCSTAVYYKDAHDRAPSAEEHEAFTKEFAAKKKWRWVVPKGSRVRNNCFFEELRFDPLKPAVKVEAK